MPNAAKPTNRRKRNEKIGRLAEFAALIYMGLKGYRFLQRRFKCSAGEIDLIFKRGNDIVFCEVKFRRDKNTLLYSMTQNQKNRVTRAAEFWMAQNVSRNNTKQSLGQNQMMRHSARFDFIGLTMWQKPTHIKNAF